MGPTGERDGAHPAAVRRWCCAAGLRESPESRPNTLRSVTSERAMWNIQAWLVTVSYRTTGRRNVSGHSRSPGSWDRLWSVHGGNVRRAAKARMARSPTDERPLVGPPGRARPALPRGGGIQGVHVRRARQPDARALTPRRCESRPSHWRTEPFPGSGGGARMPPRRMRRRDTRSPMSSPDPSIRFES